MTGYSLRERRQPKERREKKEREVKKERQLKRGREGKSEREAKGGEKGERSTAVSCVFPPFSRDPNKGSLPLKKRKFAESEFEICTPQSSVLTSLAEEDKIGDVSEVKRDGAGEVPFPKWGQRRRVRRRRGEREREREEGEGEGEEGEEMKGTRNNCNSNNLNNSNNCSNDDDNNINNNNNNYNNNINNKNDSSIFFKKYELGKELGRGHYGVVRICTDIFSGRKFAVKTLEKKSLRSESEREDVRREIAIMESLKGHKNVVNLEEWFEDDNGVYIVMEMCEGGELYEKIVREKFFSEEKSAKIFAEICGVVGFMHRNGVVHRDLKPENLLLGYGNGGKSGKNAVKNEGERERKEGEREGEEGEREELSETEDFSIKVADFGLAVVLNGVEDKCSGTAGSPFYMAPEVVNGGKYDEKADIWSLGVILYILLSGVPPFWGSNEQKIFDSINRGFVDFSEHPWPQVSSFSKKLILKMLRREAEERVTAEELLEDEWFKRVLGRGEGREEEGREEEEREWEEERQVGMEVEEEMEREEEREREREREMEREREREELREREREREEVREEEVEEVEWVEEEDLGNFREVKEEEEKGEEEEEQMSGGGGGDLTKVSGIFSSSFPFGIVTKKKRERSSRRPRKNLFENLFPEREEDTEENVERKKVKREGGEREGQREEKGGEHNPWLPFMTPSSLTEASPSPSPFPLSSFSVRRTGRFMGGREGDGEGEWVDICSLADSENGEVFPIGKKNNGGEEGRKKGGVRGRERERERESDFSESFQKKENLLPPKTPRTPNHHFQQKGHPSVHSYGHPYGQVFGNVYGQGHPPTSSSSLGSNSPFFESSPRGPLESVFFGFK